MSESEMQQQAGGSDPEVDGPALSGALDAFVEAYGHGITWAEVLPLVAEASGLRRAFDPCVRCEGRGDTFNGGWKRQPCPDCDSTGRGPFRGWELALRSTNGRTI